MPTDSRPHAGSAPLNPRSQSSPSPSPSHLDTPQDDTPSLALRAYRLLLPVRLRKAVRARAGVDNWERLRRRMESPAYMLRLALHRWARMRLRRRGLLGEQRVAVRTDGGTRVALLCVGLTALQARERNLRLVCTALREAEVPYFAVRTPSNDASAVGISADDRAAAEKALVAMCARETAYLSRPRSRNVEYGGTERAWRRHARENVLRVTCYQSDPAAPGVALGTSHGCDVEVWEPDGEQLLAPRRNLTCERLPRTAPLVEAPGTVFTRLASAETKPRPAPVVTRPEFAEPLPEDIHFPIDAVYTWVDGADPEWQRRRAAVTGEPYHPEAANAARYLNRDELRYSLRSLHQYAPWIRHIYLVTDQQVPWWLDTGHPQLTVVDHRDIFSDPSLLPTFNSHAIESQLHHIEGLTEHFIYFNDDVFLGRPATPQHFFFANGVTKFFPSKALLPASSSDEAEVPVDAAGMTNRRLLSARFGSSITQKMKHTPCALSRTVLYEIEREFAEDHRRTAAGSLRSADDISIPTSLHHYYAFHTGRAVPAEIRYDYIDVSRPGAEPRLRRLLDYRSRITFCLNDTVTCEGEEHTTTQLVRAFLDSYFPIPSPFERHPVPSEEVPLPCPSPSPFPTTPAPSAAAARTHAP